jgi:hypothetical protein
MMMPPSRHAQTEFGRTKSTSSRLTGDRRPQIPPRFAPAPSPRGPVSFWLATSQATRHGSPGWNLRAISTPSHVSMTLGSQVTTLLISPPPRYIWWRARQVDDTLPMTYFLTSYAPPLAGRLGVICTARRGHKPNSSYIVAYY